MHLARVIGRVVATRRYPGLEGAPFQWVQPVGEDGRDEGRALVAAAVVSAGPGDLVQVVDGREAALACPETFVPVDAAIVGYVEQAFTGGRDLGAESRLGVRGGAGTDGAGDAGEPGTLPPPPAVPPPLPPPPEGHG